MQKIKTVIVDDEARIRRGIERLVQSCGEEWEVVATLSDGKEALDYLHGSQGAVDLLITDVRMPVMDGLALIKEAKRHYSFYPMLVSGYDDFDYLQTAIREGAVDYILKPVDRDQFRERLADLRGRILDGRSESWKRGETERQAEKLRPARQTQTLSYITSAGIDIERLGYWVEDFPRGRYLLLYASLDTLPVKSRGYTTKDWEAYTFALENIIAEVATNYERQTGFQGWSWRGGNTDFWVLVGCDDPEADLEREAEALSEQVRVSIHTYMPFTVSVSIASPIEDLYLLPEARREALSLMRHRLVEGGNRVFRLAELASPAGESGDAASRLEAELPSLALRLRQAVANANVEEADALLRQYFAELAKSSSPAFIRSASQNLLIQIHSAALDGGGAEGAEADAVEREIRSLDQVAGLPELRAMLARRMTAIMDAIQAARRDGNRKPIEQAKEWIAGNLGGDLSIKRIADHVYLNPTYFCEYFKLQTGETVLDYVTRQRMEKAKELLADPAAKLQEVSASVGYQDAKYFSKLFKAWAGMSPSKYRERG
ncbi:response regulator transcription factor [Cohnella fermenti]|uniref:Response regulator n=1 Tax=Cohnella fermenti TaxID=2565925 RepID=A0A4S4BEJ1_9BACL|nr:response regulator [Cohnella fermenti]THF72575.1 response regulator [Cohnella fermenti]